MIPESSLAKGWYCIHQAIFAIASKILFPLNFMFFCFFFISGWSLNVLMFREGQRVPLQPGPACSERSVSLHSQLFKPPVVLAMSSPTSFGDRPRAICGSQGTCDTDFPTGTPQGHDFNLVRVKFGWPGRGSWCRVNQMGTAEEACTLVFSNQEAPLPI